MISFILYILLLSSRAPLNTLENLCGTMFPRIGDNDWGDGCFRMPTNFYATVYSDTVGSVYGMLKPYYFNVMVYDRENHQVKLNGIESESIGDYKTIFIKTKKTSSSKYVLISWKNVESPLFLSKIELDNYKTEYYTYLDLICKDTKSLKNLPSTKMGVNLPMSCVNLRWGPSTDFPIISCVPGNDQCNGGEMHITVLERKGIWIKVEVVKEIVDPAHHNEEYEDEPCPSLVISKQIGWMKAVDDSGYPNLWYASSGY